MSFDPTTAKPVKQGFDSNSAKPIDPEIPDYRMIGMPVEQPESKPEPSWYDQAIGLGETAVSLGTGATTGALGFIQGALTQLANEIASGQYGTQEAAKRVQDMAMSMASQGTYEPRTETGKEYVGQAAEVLEPLAAVTPQLMSAQMARPNLPFAKSPSKREIINQKVLAGESDISTLGYKAERPLIEPSGNYIGRNGEMTLSEAPGVPRLGNQRVVKTGADKALIKVGFDENLPPALRNYTAQADKKAFIEQVKIAENMRFKDALVAQQKHPLDVVGETLKAPYDYVGKLVRDSGRQVGIEGKKLKGLSVDFEPAVSKFRTSLEDLGVSVGDDWTLGFDKSQLRGKTLKPLREKIQDVVDYMRQSPEIDGYAVHSLKKYIDEIVDFDKLGKGASKNVEDVLKGLRHDMNKVLRDASEGYAKANTMYSDAITAKELFEKILGKKINYKDPDSVRAIGSELRKLVSNYGKKFQIEALINDSKGVVDIAKKYGGKFDGNPQLQTLFAIALDKRFGLQRKGTLQQSQKQGITDAMIDVGAVSRVPGAETTRQAMNIFRKNRTQDDMKALEAVKRFIDDLEVN